jgi:hypothetical protein
LPLRRLRRNEKPEEQTSPTTTTNPPEDRDKGHYAKTRGGISFELVLRNELKEQPNIERPSCISSLRRKIFMIQGSTTIQEVVKMMYLVEVVDSANTSQVFLLFDELLLAEFLELYEKYKKEARERSLEKFCEMLDESGLPFDWIDFDSALDTFTI